MAPITPPHTAVAFELVLYRMWGTRSSLENALGLWKSLVAVIAGDVLAGRLVPEYVPPRLVVFDVFHCGMYVHRAANDAAALSPWRRWVLQDGPPWLACPMRHGLVFFPIVRKRGKGTKANG